MGKLLITGAQGMLGHALRDTFSDHELLTWDKAELDITDRDAVLAAITQEQPTAIINAAAYTAVDDCETQRDIAMRVNGDAPGYLAEAAAQHDIPLVHYSTDYVFNGGQADGYNEDDSRDPINAYGESKAKGEEMIEQVAQETGWNQYYILRTAWLYGPHGNNFVSTMITLAETKDQLNVVNDQHGSPTYTYDLAQQTAHVLNTKPQGGIFHATNSGNCTWFEFAQHIFELHGDTLTVEPCTTDEFPRPAKRPEYSILNNKKLPALRNWQDALAEYISQHHSNNNNS